MSDWYKDRCFWRKKNDDGSNGKGDLIFNTADEIIKKKLRGEEMDEWDRSSLSGQRMLLSLRMRWPNYMNEDAPEWDVDTWARRIINRSRNKIRHWIRKKTGITIGKLLQFRFQGRMTRDPYTAWATACILAGEEDLIDTLRLPWYIYSAAFWNWWEYIKTHDEKYLKRYRFWDRPSNIDFVARLEEIREIAINQL